MTDACGMLSNHYQGERRDLCASILFTIPILREFILLLGNVDASSSTARYNLKKNRSVLIYIGGEKEQLLTETGKHKIFIKSRKGFVKLAIQHGAYLVPMYTFGENDLYQTSNFLLGFRLWLQHTFQIGLPFIWGRWGILPYKKQLRTEIGKPLHVARKGSSEIAEKDIDELHGAFVSEMQRLFDRTKVKYPEHREATLQIL